MSEKEDKTEWIWESGAKPEASTRDLSSLKISPFNRELAQSLNSLDEAQMVKISFRAAARVLPLYYRDYAFYEHDKPLELNYPDSTNYHGIVYILGIWSLFVCEAAARGNRELVHDLAAHFTILLNPLYNSIMRSSEFSTGFNPSHYEVYKRQVTSASILSSDIEPSTQVVVANYIISNALAAVEIEGPTNLKSLAEEISLDISDCSNGVDVFSCPLWRQSARPFQSEWKRVRERLLESPENFSFWVDWYEGCLAGNPIPFNLHSAVSRIESDLWRSGIETVSAQIDLLQEQYTLQQQATSIRKELKEILQQQSEQPNLHRAHNNPPELVESVPRDDIIIAITALQEIAGELGRERPSGSILSFLINKLELALDSIIKWAAPLSVGFVVLNPQTTMGFMSRLVDFIARLAGS